MFFSSTLLGQKLQNLQKLPAKYKIHGNLYYAVTLLALSVMFGAEPIYILIKNYNHILDQESKHLVFFIVALLFLFVSLDQFIKRGFLIISKDEVSCEYLGLLGKRRWCEKIANYEGIKIKNEFGASGNVGAQIFYTIWLKHKKNSRSIRIYRAWSDEKLEEECSKYSSLWGLKRIN